MSESNLGWSDADPVDQGGGFDAMAAGAAYALYRHGQDVQTEQLIRGLQQRPTPQQPLLVGQAGRSDWSRTDIDPVNAAEHYRDPPLDSWDEFKGQGPLKERLAILMGAAQKQGVRLPHLLLISEHAGAGKLTAARLIARSMKQPFYELLPPFNAYTLADALETLSGGGILCIDEVDKLAGSGLPGSEVLPKLLAEGVLFLPDGQVVEAEEVSIIGATTAPGALVEGATQGFSIQSRFTPYSTVELGTIAIALGERHDCSQALFSMDEDSEEDSTALVLAMAKACRGNPGVLKGMVLAAATLYEAWDRRAAPGELLEFLETEADGLTLQHIQYLTVLYKKCRHVLDDGTIEYAATTRVLSQLLRETIHALARTHAFLIEREYLDATPRGFALTAAGIDRAEELLRVGKGGSNADRSAQSNGERDANRGSGPAGEENDDQRVAEWMQFMMDTADSNWVPPANTLADIMCKWEHRDLTDTYAELWVWEIFHLMRRKMLHAHRHGETIDFTIKDFYDTFDPITPSDEEGVFILVSSLNAQEVLITEDEVRGSLDPAQAQSCLEDRDDDGNVVLLARIRLSILATMLWAELAYPGPWEPVVRALEDGQGVKYLSDPDWWKGDVDSGSRGD